VFTALGATVVGDVVVVVVVPGLVTLGVVTVGCTVGVFVIVLLVVVPAGVLPLLRAGVVVVAGVVMVEEGCCTGFEICPLCLLAGLVVGAVVFTCAEAMLINRRPVSV
jgi:hypothetical protein